MALSTPSTTTSTRLNVRRPVAWLSAFALLASGLIVAQQVAAPDATAAAPAGMTTSPGPLFTLSSPWLPAGASPHDYLFVTGNNASLGSANFVDDEGARPKSNTFIGYWQGDGGTAGDIANPWPTYAAGYGDIDNYTAPNGWRGNANYQGRMSAIDSGDYVGTAGYVGNGASLYVWSFDAQDYWVGATGHPAEFTDSMIGYRPGKPQTEANLCRPSGWGQDNKGSWISVIEYPAGSVEGTVFWVPNPRAADFMSVYKAAHTDYPGTYDVARDPSWPCTTDAGLYHDGWGGGEVIQSTGEIFFTGRQSAKLDTTYRAMIFNPKTGAFAASGLLQPADPDDGIFGAKAAVAGDLMVDGDGNGYVIAEGRAPAGSVWHDPNDLNPTGSQRAYLLRIVPTPNPAYNPSDPNSMRYLHNGGWKYNIVQRIYSDPTTGNTGNLYSVFGRPGKNSADTSAQAIKGSNWFNGLLYAANNNDLFVINPMSGRAQHVPADKSATVNRLLPNQSSINLNPRDMATGQEALTIDGVVFYDENGDGTRQDGEWGVPGVQLALYSDLDEDGVWTLETDPGQRNTGSSGEYTMFLSSYGTYQIRVVSPDFNPNADPASATFEADVRKDTVAAVQTSASSGRSTHTSTLGQTLENKVTAHCYDYAADKVVAVVDQTLITQPNGTQTDRPCAGNLKQPFTDGPYADGATPTVGSPFTSPTTQAAIYSTLTITNSHLVPDADFGLATLTSYKVGAVSDGDTDTFTVAGQALTTTAEGVQATSGDIGPVTPGAQTTAVQLPSDDWTVSQVEVKSGNTVVATPAYSPTDATHGTFQWTLPPNSDLTAVVHFLKDLACDPGQSELAVTPDGPIEAGASYTLTVTAKDKNGDRCRDRTAVTFGAAPAGPTFSSVTCTTSAVTGVCSVQATSTKAGTFALSAQMADPATGLAADIKNSPASRQWTHATCHADSSLVMVPASASVRETSVATLSVVDEYNNPCDDVSPVLSDTDGLDFALSSGPGSAADDPDKSQSAQGVYTWPMTSETPGTFNPVATLPANPAFREEAEVTYYDEDVSPTNSSFTAVADDGALPVYVEESYTVTAVLRNASDQPLSGHDVDFTAPGVTFTPASCTTDAQGTCSVVATTTAPAHKSGTFAIVAKTGTLTLNPNTADWQKGNGDRYPAPAPPNIRFWGGPGIDNARLTVDPDHQTAGSDVSVRIEALDKYDNPVTDLVEADLTLVGDPVDPATNPPIGPNPGSFDDSGAASGVFYFSTTSKLIGEFVLTGTGRGQTIKDHPHVWFTAGPVCTVNCEPVDPTHQTRIEMLNNGALANGKDKDTARSWAYDHYGNPVEGALTVSSRAPSSPDLMPATQQVAAGPDGTADLAWTSSKGGVYTAVNTIDGQSAFPGSALDNIRFVDTPVDVSKSTLDITPGKADRPIPAGDAYTAKVTAVDVDGRPVAGVPVQFDAQPKAGTTPRHPLELSNTGCTTGADGSCSITVTGKSAGEYTIWAKVSDPATGAMTDVGGGGDPDRRSPQDVSWKAGDICVPSADKTCDPDPDFQTSVRVTRNDQPGDGVSTDEATLKGFDAYGNPVPGAPWTSAKAQAGDPLTVVTPAGTLGADGQSVISYSATADGSYQADVAAAGQTVPGSPVTLRFTHAPGTCTMDKTPADGVQAGGAYTITTRCTNQAGVPDAGKAVAHRTDSPDLSFVAGLSTCTTDPLGTCSVQVTATVAGTYEVDYVDPPASTVVGAPVQVTFVAGPPSELSATHVLKNGALADGTDQDRVQVVAFDQYGNRVAGAQVTTSTAKAGLAIQPNIPVTDQQGEVLIWYTSVVATTYPVDFKVGDAVPTGGDGSPVTLGFTAGAVAKVTLDVDPAGPIIVGKDPENTYTLTGTALDKEDNPVAGALIQFKLNPEAGPTYVGNNRTCVTGASGECTAQVYSTKAGSYSATAESGNVISTAKDVVWLPDKVCGVECTPDADTPSNLYTRVEVTRDGAVADGRDADQVRLWAYDKWGNAVPNQLVETTPDSPSLLPMANIPVTGDGLRGTTAGVSDISYFATAGGVYHPDIKVGLPGEMRTPRGLPVSLTFIGLKSDPPVIETVDGDDVTGGKTGLTNDPTPEIAGTGVTGDKLEVWDGLGGLVCSTTVVNGRWACAPATALADGVHTVTATQTSTQPGATASDPSNEARFTVDTTAPCVVGDTRPMCRTKDGVTPPYFDITEPKEGQHVSDSTPVFKGSGENSGDAVVIKEGDTVLCTTTVQPDRTWSCESAKALAEGEHTVTGTETDAAGNVSEPVDRTFVVDTIAPVVWVDKPKPGDWINNRSSWQVGGRVTEPDGTTPAPQATVQVTDKASGAQLCSATADAAGKWTCWIEAGLPGPDGQYTLVARATDLAGNVSAPKEVPITIRTAAPDVKITSPTVNEVTNKDPLPVRGTGENPGDKVVVDDGLGHTCETVVGQDRTWSCDLVGVPEGSIVITAKETDPAGNTGQDQVPITVDRTKPCVVNDPRPICTGQDYFDVTKVDGHDVTDAKPDHIANNLPKIEGTGEAAGDKVAITEGGAAICQATVLPDKTWSCVPTAPLADGSHTIRGTETDQAGNVSDPVERTFTIDTVAPPKPDITRPAEGSKTNDATVEVGGVIKGDIDPGTVVIAQDADDPSNQCTAVVQADKTWSCVLPKALPDGVRTVTAHAKDPAGNVSDKDEVHFTVDTTPPWINPDTRDPGDIVVDTEPNSDVVIEDDEGKVICTAHADGAGQAVCHVGDPDDVPRPGDEITITATDEAGNTATKTTRIIQVVVSDKQVVLPLEQSQTATGFFFQPGERVHGVVQPSGQDLGYQTADATGKVVFTWSIADRDQSVGNHTAVLTGSWSGPGEDTFQVSRELPKTGSEVDDAFIAAASLASALGVAFIMMAWRRRREEKKVS